MSLLAATICFITCHAGPAEHFAVFGERLAQDGYTVNIYASGPALNKLSDNQTYQLIPFADLSLESHQMIANSIAKDCSSATAVMTDVGNEFATDIQRTLALKAPKVLRLAYYDNPEPYVPGGYSSIAAETIILAQKTLFANANLASSPLYKDPTREVRLPFAARVGIGYYPIEQSKKIAAQRNSEHTTRLTAYLARQNIPDKTQQLLAYFGGNNEEYYTHAFPAFLHFLTEGIKVSNLSDTVILFQQHPGAKYQNRDRALLEEWIKRHGDEPNSPKIIVSDLTANEVLVLADGVLYYQTSMGPLFALVGIPTIQVGHKTYEDVLVRNQLGKSAHTTSDFLKSLSELQQEPYKDNKKVIFQALGIKDNWFDVLKSQLES